MSTSALDIGTIGLLLGYLLLILPIFFILYYRVRLLKGLTVAVLRMTLQLLFVGLYLQFVFELNAWWLNILWLLLMLAAADISLLSAAGMRFRRFWPAVFFSLLLGMLIPLAYFLAMILRLPDLLDARYFIPIAGMILGNSLRADIVGLRSFYRSLQSGEKAYLFALSQGASLNEAVRPYLKKAVAASLAPTVAAIATIGLVSLPGMMTGIMLGGTDPMTAIKYQIAIMLAIFAGTTLTVVLGIRLTARGAFRKSGILDPTIFSRPES